MSLRSTRSRGWGRGEWKAGLEQTWGTPKVNFFARNRRRTGKLEDRGRMLGWLALRGRLGRKGVGRQNSLVSGAERKQHQCGGQFCRVKCVGALERTLKGPVYGEARGGATESHLIKREKQFEERHAGMDRGGGGGEGM